MKFRDTVQVTDRQSRYYQWNGSVVSVDNYSVSVEFGARFTGDRRSELKRTGTPRPISFTPSQLTVVAQASSLTSNWRPPRMPWESP